MTQDAARERLRYNWVKRLQEADPGSDLLQKEAAIIEEQQPDIISGTGTLPAFRISPFAADHGLPVDAFQLLDRPPTEWVEVLNDLSWISPPAMTPPIPVLELAATRSPEFGITLAQAMMIPEPKDTPAWPAIITGLCQAELTREQQSSVLGIMSNPTIQARHGDAIAEHLYGLVKHGGKPYALEVIDQAEHVASSLWTHIECDTPPAQNESWFDHARSYSRVGYLPLFWANAAGIRMRLQGQRNLTDECRESLGTMLGDTTTKGMLAQSAIGAQAAFLLKADEEWTANNLIPVFANNEDPRARVSWEGFLRAQHVDEITSQYLGGVMHRNLNTIADSLPSPEDQRFLARCYSTILCYYVPDPGSWLKDAVVLGEQIATLTQMEIHNRLRHTDAVQQRDWWSRWIRDYWADRQQGIPEPFSPQEAVVMWGWATEMPAVYPQVAQMAAGIPLEHVDWIHLEPLLERLSQLPPARENGWDTAEILAVLLQCVQPDQYSVARRIVEPLVRAVLEGAKDTANDRAKEALIYQIVHWMQQTSLQQE